MGQVRPTNCPTIKGNSHYKRSEHMSHYYKNRFFMDSLATRLCIEGEEFMANFSFFELWMELEEVIKVETPSF